MPGQYDDNIRELEKSMTPRQIKFCQEYIKTSNGSLSATEAGYSKQSCGSIANRLLKQEYIRVYIAALQDVIRNEAIADATEIQRLLTAIGRGKTTDETLDINGDVKTLQTNTREQIKALDVLASIQGLKNDTLHLKHESRIKFVDDWQPDKK